MRTAIQFPWFWKKTPLTKSLLKCANFKKTPLPWKSSGCAPGIVVIINFRHDISLHLGGFTFYSISLAKWYKKQRFKAQHRTLSNNFLEFSENYKSTFFKKPLWMVTLRGWQLIFFLNQWYSKAGKSWFQYGGGRDGLPHFIVELYK